VNKSGSRYLTFYVNTTDKNTCPKSSKGFSAGVEIKLTKEKALHALNTAYAYRDAYNLALAKGQKLNDSLFDGWRKRYLYSPELGGSDTPFGKGACVIKKLPVTLRVTGSDNMTRAFGECFASTLKDSLVKCVSPHKNKGAKAQTLGENPFFFVIGDGCEVA
jgi:hypothetical protein